MSTNCSRHRIGLFGKCLSTLSTSEVFDIVETERKADEISRSSLEETNQDGLASYLGINHQQLCFLLLAAGLARLHQFQTHSKRVGWDTFCVEQSLEGYFDIMAVNNNRHSWIGSA
jgi:hypothetical protein